MFGEKDTWAAEAGSKAAYLVTIKIQHPKRDLIIKDQSKAS